ncbi:MAG: metal ABC transporter permease [Muribaculaceae bacterium]|nr:metal ABC transporter permease [Muribaculaceae bacterium]
MEILSYKFFQLALLAIVVVSIASAIIGTYVVSRRMVFVTGGITHASFGGLGLGFYAGINPVLTAGAFAVASAIGIDYLSTRSHVREDTAIGVVWALGMALGTIFIFLTPGYVPELTSFLFGNILTVSIGDLIALVVFLVVLIAMLALFYRSIVSCAFDTDFSHTQGLPARTINLIMTIMTALCIVLTIRLIGVMLLMSLFTMPQVIAELRVHRFAPMMRWSVVISLLCSVTGLFLSALVGVPASATIVMLLVVVYVAVRIITAINRHAIKKRL